jgi:hypothetical protein
MTDTPAAIERKVREQMMARSNEERLIMGAEMFEAARAMIEASMPRNLPERERKRELFRRIYGQELPLT